MSSGLYRWESMKSMPTKRVFASPAVHNGQIYVLGGCDDKGIPLSNFEVYDPSTRKWTKLDDMPTKRAAPGVAVVDNKIIALGGVAEDQTPLDVVEMYDIETKKWTKLSGLKEKLLGLSVVVKDNKILIVGGMAIDTNSRDYFCSFDVSKDQWKELPTMPTARYASSSFLIGDKLYVIGGRQGKIPTAAFEAYNMSTQKWEQLPDIPSKRVFSMYEATDKHIFSIGGLQQPANKGFSDACEVFDLDKKEWKIGQPMPTKRGDFAIGVVGGKVICAGGLGNHGKPLNTVECYDQENDTWTQICDLPTPHCSCTYKTIDGCLHVIGGLSKQGPSGNMEALSFR